MIHFKRGDIVKEGFDLGMILQSGNITYDVVWIGGSTSRYRYEASRAVSLATSFDLEGQDLVLKHLREEAIAARAEREAGAHIKRGQVHPSR